MTPPPSPPPPPNPILRNLGNFSPLPHWNSLIMHVWQNQAGLRSYKELRWYNSTK